MPGATGLEVAARGAVAAEAVAGEGAGELGRALRGLAGARGRAVEEERRRVPAPGAPRAARALLRRQGGDWTLLFYGPPLADAASRALGLQVRPFREGSGDERLPALLEALNPELAAAAEAGGPPGGVGQRSMTVGTEWDIPVRFEAGDLRAGGGGAGGGGLEGPVTVGVYTVSGGDETGGDEEFRLVEARARVAEGAHVAAAKSIHGIARLLKPYVDLVPGGV